MSNKTSSCYKSIVGEWASEENNVIEEFFIIGVNNSNHIKSKIVIYNSIKKISSLKKL